MIANGTDGLGRVRGFVADVVEPVLGLAHEIDAGLALDVVERVDERRERTVRVARALRPPVVAVRALVDAKAAAVEDGVLRVAGLGAAVAVCSHCFSPFFPPPQLPPARSPIERLSPATSRILMNFCCTLISASCWNLEKARLTVSSFRPR